MACSRRRLKRNDSLESSTSPDFRPFALCEACPAWRRLDPKQIDVYAVSRQPTAHWPRKVVWTLGNRPNAAAVRDRLANAAARSEHRGVHCDEPRSRPRTRAAAASGTSNITTRIWRARSFPSPFDRAAVCAIDGFGDFVSTSIAVGRDAALQRLGSIFFPHSLGLFYLALTQYLGFAKVWRRIQGDGPGPVRRAGIRSTRAEEADSARARRQVHVGSQLLQALVRRRSR